MYLRSMFMEKYRQWRQDQEDRETLVEEMEARAIDRGVDVDELWDVYTTLGKTCDELMGPESQLIVKNPKDGGEDVLIPVEDFFKG